MSKKEDRKEVKSIVPKAQPSCLEEPDVRAMTSWIYRD
jgi:hypothetical protein